jgi:hypothetical protein
MITLARVVAVLAVALALVGSQAGCQALGAGLAKLLGPFVPEDEIQAQYEFKGRSLLILIDAKDPSLASDHPHLQSSLADAVGKVLTREKACGPIVQSRSIEAARRSEPHFSDWSVPQVGAFFNVDYVVHIEILEFRLEDISGSSTFNGYVEVAVRIVDPTSGQQVWPVLSAAKIVTGETTPNVEVSQPTAREEVLVEGFGEKIARLFFTYKVNDLPIRPKVK